MIKVDVRSNIKSVIAEFHAEVADFREKAVVRALNRAQDAAATVTSREIRKVYNIKHQAVLRAMKKFRANRANLTATLEISGARIPLIEFAALWKPGQAVGASVKILVGGARKRIGGAFIATHGGSGARQVFVRKGKARYPIKSLRSISIPQAFANDAVIAAIRQIAEDSFSKNFEQQLKFLGARRT